MERCGKHMEMNSDTIMKTNSEWNTQLSNSQKRGFYVMLEKTCM